jgi:hypothetical protein
MNTYRVTGKLTEAELNEVRKIVRPRMYWPKLILRNLYGFAFLVAVLWATIAAMVRNTNVNWQTLGLIWAAIAAIFAWSIYSTKRSSRKEFATLNAALPDWITMASDGLRFDGPAGNTAFQPWANFAGLREGKSVFIVDRAIDDGFVMLPTASLEAEDRNRILQTLKAQIARKST